MLQTVPNTPRGVLVHNTTAGRGVEAEPPPAATFYAHLLAAASESKPPMHIHERRYLMALLSAQGMLGRNPYVSSSKRLTLFP
jgi:hypothetical protein